MNFKTKILVIAVLCISFNKALCQIEYYDAIRLKRYVKDGRFIIPTTDCGARGDDPTCVEFLKTVELIKPYLRNELQVLAAKSIVVQLRDRDGNNYNPFLGPILDEPTQNSADLERYRNRMGMITKNIASSIGGINVTNFADGLSQFLVERTKQELELTFFKKFKEKLNDSNLADLKTMLPNTASVLDHVDKDIYFLSNYLNTLKEAFRKDLQNLPETALPVIESKILDANQKEYFSTAINVVKQAKSGVHPADIIKNISTQTYSSAALGNVKDAAKVFSLFSSSLRSKNSSTYWVPSDSLGLVFGDPVTLQIYLGLVYEKSKSVTIRNNVSLSTIITPALQTNLVEYIEKLRPAISDVDLSFQALKKTTDENRVQSYARAFKALCNLVEVLKNVDGLSIDQLTIGNSANNFIAETVQVSNLIVDIADKNYSLAIIDLANLLKKSLPDGSFKWEGDLVKYGSFMANVAKAETAEEVKQAIEAIALPVGSASIKKYSATNISLNAYVGLSPGYEKNSTTDAYKFTFGVTSPVGVAFSKGNQRTCTNKKAGTSIEKRFSKTLFLSLIDLGAVTAYRFDDANTEALPQLTLQNIFAPGLYYVRGVANAPISYGIGGQLGPALRDLKAGLSDSENDVNFSFRFFIAVDIPIINLFTKTNP
jgi:hypothetical protein